MNVIVITGALRDQLRASSGKAELRDEAGNLIGHFAPPEERVCDLDMTDEEIARQSAPDVRTYSTAEVLAYVKGLTS